MLYIIEGYYRNASRELNLTSTFLLRGFLKLHTPINLFITT